jgi:hypothetical protein
MAFGGLPCNSCSSAYVMLTWRLRVSREVSLFPLPLEGRARQQGRKTVRSVPDVVTPERRNIMLSAEASSAV